MKRKTFFFNLQSPSDPCPSKSTADWPHTYPRQTRISVKNIDEKKNKD